VRYEERGQGYRDVEKVGKHCITGCGSGSMNLECIKCVWWFNIQNFLAHTVRKITLHEFIYCWNMCIVEALNSFAKKIMFNWGSKLVFSYYQN
jgi:hypothetical protein